MMTENLNPQQNSITTKQNFNWQVNTSRLRVLNAIKLTSKTDQKFQEFKGIKSDNCTNCHKDPHNNKFGQNCAECHNDESFLHVRECKKL